jgi:hypothetical protein
MKRLLITLAAGLFALSACVETKSLSYSDRTVYQGTGGACENRDGIDMWWNGTPNRKYIIIGLLIQGRLSAAGDAALIREAKAMGGNGLLRGSRSSQQVGSYSTGNGFVSVYGNSATITGSSTTMAISQGEYQYYVIKYL